MEMARPEYLMKIRNEYLMAMVETFEGSGIYKPMMTIYKYDAARVPEKRFARHIIKKLSRKGEPWQIVAFNKLNGEERTAPWLK